MKKIIMALVFILLINPVYAFHIPEIKPYLGLEEVSEKYLGNHDVKIVKLEYSRELITHEQNLTTYKLNIKNKNFFSRKLIVYDELPGDFINPEYNLLDVNTEYTIINNSIVAHYIDNFDKDISIEYLVKGEIVYDVNNIIDPVFVKPIQLLDFKLAILIILFGVFFVLYLRKKIKSVKLRGFRIRR